MIRPPPRKAEGHGTGLQPGDTKRKELVGNFKNNGREWSPKGEPELVKVHDFIDPKLPYGAYDIHANVGWVSARCPAFLYHVPHPTAWSHSQRHKRKRFADQVRVRCAHVSGIGRDNPSLARGPICRGGPVLAKPAAGSGMAV